MYFEVAKHVHEGEALAFHMEAKTKGSKRARTEEKKEEDVPETDEGREQAEEKKQEEHGQLLQAEKEVATQKLRRLEGEQDSARTRMAKLTRQRENLEGEGEAKKGSLDLVQRKVPPLPKDIYFEVAKHVQEGEALAFAMICRDSWDAMKEALKTAKNTTYADQGRMLLTTGKRKYKDFKGVRVSEKWIEWAFCMKWEYAAARRKDNEEEKENFLAYVAALGGYEDVLLWLKGEGVRFDSRTCRAAAEGGHINVLKYLKSEGVAFDSWTCRSAAQSGHINVLKYLKSEGVEFDSDTCRAAAEGGHINVLKYFKSEGVEFDSVTCYFCYFVNRMS